MADEQEKTEQPSQRRQEKARERGDVPRSRELNTAIVLLMGILAIRFLGPRIAMGIEDVFKITWSSDLWSADGLLYSIIPLALTKTMTIVLPMMLILAGVGFMVGFAQVGGVFSLQAISPDFSRINPAKGFSRIFSKMGLMEMVKSLMKIAIIGYVGYSTIKGQLDDLPSLASENAVGIAGYSLKAIFDLGMRVTILMLFVAAMDYGFQRWQHMQNLKMTRRELKEELKETEGDPLIRSFIREKQIEVARRRMIQEVPKADVVVTNPQHIAVALKYDKETAPSPLVVAKGADFLAQKIKEIAWQHNVPIFENPPLARALYESVEIGEMIPEELYFAVAQILAQVYRMRGVAV
jgi:flagellar biosynthetic protein FlhB